MVSPLFPATVLLGFHESTIYIYIYIFESSDPHGLSISLSNPAFACSVDSFEATPAQGIKRCRPISESPFGWSSGELVS